jgi:hypothetical protein
MGCLKVFGERISARDPDRQIAEIQIRIALMNRFAALATADIVRVAETQREKWKLLLRPELHTNVFLTTKRAKSSLGLRPHRGLRK